MDTPRKKSRAPSVILLIILVVIFIIIVGASNRPTDQNYVTDPVATPVSTPNNIQSQSACIAEAQSEVDNNALYQPAVNNDVGIAQSNDEKLMAMQSKISDCKAQYPTN